MKLGPPLLAFIALASSQAPAQERPLSATHDGRWSVQLVCDDVKGKNALVKGYEYSFDATVEGGRLQGQYGSKGAPGSITYTGTVQADGTLDIDAVGHTGKSEFSVGRIAQGTPYKYTLHGRLGASGGQATRRELRPCTATFTRQP